VFANLLYPKSPIFSPQFGEGIAIKKIFLNIALRIKLMIADLTVN
jgi:hypothetical protein